MTNLRCKKLVNENHSSIDLQKPTNQKLPLVVSLPHSGREYSQEFLSQTCLNSLEIRRSEDAFVDEIFAETSTFGIPYLCALFPRALIDPNRAEWELDSDMFIGEIANFRHIKSKMTKAGFGMIPRCVATGAEIYEHAIPSQTVSERIEKFYKPYHIILEELIKKTKSKFNQCLLLDCHSMPSLRESNERGIGLIRKDIVLGDRFGTACHKEVTDISKIILQDLGFSVAINEPYAGAYITSHYGQPKSKINAIQIEINRGLYMDENSIKRLPRINDLNKLMLQFLKRLGQTMLLY